MFHVVVCGLEFCSCTESWVFLPCRKFSWTPGEKRIPVVLSKWYYSQNQIYTKLLFVHAGRIYKCLFTGSVSSLLTLPLDILSTWVLQQFHTKTCFSQITLRTVTLELSIPFIQLHLLSSTILSKQLPISLCTTRCMNNSITIEITLEFHYSGSLELENQLYKVGPG